MSTKNKKSFEMNSNIYKKNIQTRIFEHVLIVIK